MADRERIEPADRPAWRGWLAKHHASSPGVWLVYFKKASGRSRLTYPEIVEEALCFGWIDSLPRALNDERAMQYVSPRKPGSPWSRVNKRRVETLIETGLMTEAGLAKIEVAKSDGSWSSYDAVESLTVPPDLKRALAAERDAEHNFAAFSDSTKKQLLWWITSAKRPATRMARITKLVASATKNTNPLARATGRRS